MQTSTGGMAMMFWLMWWREKLQKHWSKTTFLPYVPAFNFLNSNYMLYLFQIINKYSIGLEPHRYTSYHFRQWEAWL
jgi:hypothetical protein